MAEDSPVTTPNRVQSWLSSTQTIVILLGILFAWGVRVEIGLSKQSEFITMDTRLSQTERDMMVIKEQNIASITDRAELHKEGAAYQSDIANLRVDIANMNGKADLILKNQEREK